MKAMLVLAMSGLMACSWSSAGLLEPRTDLPGPTPVRAVADAVYSAASERGWDIVEQRAGVVLMTTSAGGHDATVAVEYDRRGWSIFHVRSSPGLKFRPHSQRPSIHRRYNLWVSKLDQAIWRALSEGRRPVRRSRHNRPEPLY